MEPLRPIHLLSLEGELKCKICKQMSISPIHTCSISGHIVCGTCIETNKQCRHNCPDPLIPSYFAEGLVRKHDVRLPCRNTDQWGCKQLIKSWEMKVHLERCKRRKAPIGVKCFEKKGKQCNKEKTYMNLHRFAEHLRDYHECYEARKSNPTDDWFKTFTSNRTLNNKNFCVLPSTVFDFDDKYFILHEVHRKAVVYRWMTIAADHNNLVDEDVSYNCCLKISSEGKSLYEWTLPVLLLAEHQNLNTINMSDNNKFASMRFDHLELLRSPHEDYPFSWKTDVKIIKTTGNQTVLNYGLKLLIKSRKSRKSRK